MRDPRGGVQMVERKKNIEGGGELLWRQEMQQQQQ